MTLPGVSIAASGSPGAGLDAVRLFIERGISLPGPSWQPRAALPATPGRTQGPDVPDVLSLHPPAARGSSLLQLTQTRSLLLALCHLHASQRDAWMLLVGPCQEALPAGTLCREAQPGAPGPARTGPPRAASSHLCPRLPTGEPRPVPATGTPREPCGHIPPAQVEAAPVLPLCPADPGTLKPPVCKNRSQTRRARLGGLLEAS